MHQYSLYLLLLFQVLHTSGDVFFHELSHFTLTPESGNQETFGFSMAYQNKKKNLVVGAPHSGRTGKVFNCPLGDVVTNTTVRCSEAVIDVDALAPYNKDIAPSVKLNLGYSVSSMNENFLTCAPLWTENYEKKRPLGTCFLYNHTAHRYPTYVETHVNEENLQSFYQKSVYGNGWRTFVDDKWLMVSAPLDVTYENASYAHAQLESIALGVENDLSVESQFIKLRNVGFSIAAGKFFSKETIYAISALESSTSKGVVYFIGPEWKKNEGVYKLNLLRNTDKGYLMITETKSIGSMFGVAMCSANLDLDDNSELLVGAPAWGDRTQRGYDVGAVHIYLGGPQGDIKKPRRHQVIFGNKDGSRFGTAIAATDLDGDNLSEIFVSAPYENSGEGALYIFSGYEIKERLTSLKRYKTISISQLNRKQRIAHTQFKTFGHSLQVLPDLDGNKCDELAVGSPRSENIMVLRCIPIVNVTVTAQLIGGQLKLEDKSFIIRVRVTVEDLKNRSLALSFTLKSEVEGNGVYIDNSKTTISIDIPGRDKTYEKVVDIEAKMNNYELGEYIFNSSVTMDTDSKIMNTKAFDRSWAVISPYSQLEDSVHVSRQCKDYDCNPIFTMEMSWSEGHIINGSSYVLGSSEVLAAHLLITNSGNISLDACAWVQVTGATVRLTGCDRIMGQYKCSLPKGLKGNTTHPIDITLDMRRPTNEDKQIKIDVVLHNFCDRPENTTSYLTENLQLNLDTKNVILTGSFHDQYISDTQIQDQRNSREFKDVHEYWIENKGNVTWNNVVANVTVYKQPFIKSSRVKNWMREDFSDRTVFSYSLSLLPGSRAKIIASIDILKNKIVENLKDDKLTVQSSLILFLHPTSKTIEETIKSTIIFQKEIQLGQNKNLIILLAVIVALIVLAVIIYILYKMQFFKSEEKEKLEELKQNINRNVTRSMSPSNDVEECEGLEMEVEDDNAFEVIDMTTPVLQEENTKND